MPDATAGSAAPPTVGVVGLGRLGNGVVRLCAQRGRTVGLTVSRTQGWNIAAPAAVLIDASGPGALDEVLAHCRKYRAALVECVSDLGSRDWAALHDLALEVPVVRATNLSLGHHLQSTLMTGLAALRPEAVAAPEASVHERHPATKAHRPSASAVRLADRWRGATGTAVAEISSRRAGPAVSDHEVLWCWPDESLLLRHSVTGIAAAAAGALAAADWAAGRAPGLTEMDTVYDDLLRAPARRVEDAPR